MARHRIDHCSNVIHFTKGSEEDVLNYNLAFNNLMSIVEMQGIWSSNKMILGKRECICFTESPVRCLTNRGQLDAGYFDRYTPFGVQFAKQFIYNNEGRPVIYSNRSEYEREKNNSNLNWRFVSYDPNLGGKLDFTWEREWRIVSTKENKGFLQFTPNDAKLVFPNRQWIDHFIMEHESRYHNSPEDDSSCNCERRATVYNFTDFMNEEKCETIVGSCPDPSQFPWELINMNQES